MWANDEKGLKLFRSSRPLKTDTPYSVRKVGNGRALLFHDSKGGVVGRLPLLDGSSRGKVTDAGNMEGGQAFVSGWISESAADNPPLKLIIFLDDDYLLAVKHLAKRPLSKEGEAASYRFDVSLTKQVFKRLKGGSDLRILIIDSNGPVKELLYRYAKGDFGGRK